MSIPTTDRPAAPATPPTPRVPRALVAGATVLNRRAGLEWLRSRYGSVFTVDIPVFGSTVVVADLTENEIPSALTDLTEIAGLVHCAGVAEPGRLADPDPALWRRAFEINVLAVVTLTAALLPALRAAGGHVVVVNSGAGRAAKPDRGAYFATVADLMAAVGTGGGIVKASDDDINWLVDDDDPIAYAEAWAVEYGLSMFIVTLGADGVVAVKPDGRQIRVPGHRVDLVDTVGAGDTFMAGFLSAYAVDPMDVEAALVRGAAASALVCSRKGANPPTSAEVGAFLAR